MKESRAASHGHNTNQLSRQILDASALQDMKSNREKVGNHYTYISKYVSSQADMPTGVVGASQEQKFDRAILSSLGS